jgi:hypothetical protein
MEEESITPAAAGRKKPFILFRIFQWIVIAFLGLLALVLLVDASKLGIAGAPVVLFWLTLAALAGLAILHSPPLFFQLPAKSKIAAYVGVFIGVMMCGSYIGQMRTAYESTPEGAKEAELRRQEEARIATLEAKRAETQQALERLAQTQQQLENINARLEACRGWSGQLPALADAVKDSLHNPGSFEHVETIFIVPDEDRRNVVMQFRGENGFGALRTATVKAQVLPDDCTVQNVGEPVVE